ncbi:MAG TPA: hypothetical protein PLH19_15125 [Anaerolineae bacterium]|nr:hypothetical protein [Anaerolineae bacterium]HQH39846.1 hypothetical protein [Anaerolineae bacterium]
MHDPKLRLWCHGPRWGGAVKDQESHYGTILLWGFAAILLLLATGGWTAPVVVVAAPATPAEGATFNITWSTSCETPPPEAVTAFDYAAGLWGTWISSTVPIEVSACWSNAISGGDGLAYGGPVAYQYDFPAALWGRTHYPIALANALSGYDLMPGFEDIGVKFDATVDWSFTLTPTLTTNTSAENKDFVAVALHELAHGLGFIGNMYEQYSVGFCYYRDYCPTPYDQLVVDSTAVPLLSYLTPDPRELGKRLESDANFSGPNTIAANTGAAAKLYTPYYWAYGISLSHLDESTFQTGDNRLMIPRYSGITRHPGPVTLAIFQDMGWLRVDGVPNVVTAGPLILGAGQVATLTGGLVWSRYAGQPITYTWAATEQLTVTHPGLTASDSVTFTWGTPGDKRITLAVTDGVTSAHATRAALVYDVTASGATQGDTNHAYTFNAAILPEITIFPITYTWEATDKTPIVHANLYQTYDSAAFTWTTPGTKTITITAAMAGATTHDVHEIVIEGLVLDKHIFLPLVLRQS